MASQIQTLIFAKNKWSLQDAKSFLKEHGFKYSKVDTKYKLTYRFRQRNKRKGWNYRTIKLTDGVTAVVSFPTIKGGFSLSVETPPNVEAMINKYGNNKVVGMTVCRTPLNAPLHGLLNAITFGKSQEILKARNFSAFFHLFGVVKLDNGVFLKMEKNEQVKITETTEPNYSETECMPIPKADNSGKTFGEMWQKMLNTYPYDYIFQYKTVDQNCQVFLYSFLKCNSLDYPRVRSWINQDVKGAIESPFVRKVLNVATDTFRSIKQILSKIF